MVEYNFNFKNSIFNKELIKEARQNAIRRESQKDISAQEVNEITNYLEKKCNNAGIFKDLTDEEIESRLKAEEQSPLKLIKNLISSKHTKDSSGVNDATNQGKDLCEIDSSGVNPLQNDNQANSVILSASEVSQSPQGGKQILRHFVPQNDVSSHTEQSEGVNYATNQGKGLGSNDNQASSVILSASEVSKNANLSGATQQLVESFAQKIGNSETAQELETEFTPTPVENRANATTSVSISDTDGAKQLTLAVGDKLNVTYVYGEKTFNYTIEAQSAQEITLQTEDGYLSVLGNNLAGQTGDVQYSNIALVGTTNSLKIGTNGKTYNANSIAYNSAEGGHSIYTWGDPPEPEADLTLGRANSGSNLASVGSFDELSTTEYKILELKNPFDKQVYRYKIKARDMEHFEEYSPDYSSLDYIKSQQKAQFQFLENGRLVITGSWLDIEAMDGQQDDLIILGHYNNITTGDENDIVRVGTNLDRRWESNYVIKDRLEYSEGGVKTNLYYSSREGRPNPNKGIASLYNTSTQEGLPAYAAVGNHVNTGDGADYVTLAFNQNDRQFTVDMGNGDDKILLGNRQTYAISANELEDEQKERITGTEMIRGLNEDGSTLDGYDGWGNQLGQQTLSDGGCMMLSFINSLGRCTNKGNLSEYAQITDNKNGSYTVKFLNYKNVPSGKSDTITITEADYCGITGDFDSILVISAFRKLALENYPTIPEDSVKNNCGNLYVTYICNYKRDILSSMFYGNTNSEYEYGKITKLTEQEFLNIVSHYLTPNGELKNLVLGCRGTDDYSIGVVSDHAYALKSIVEDTNGVKFVELVNPWDDADNVKVSLSNILKYWTITVYGHTKSQLNAFKDKAFGE